MRHLEFSEGYFTYGNTRSGHCSWFILEYKFAADLI